MEDFEQIALGLATGKSHKAPIRAHVVLSDAQLTQLARVHKGDPLYDVLLQIMEGVLETLETEHLQNWKDKELFDRTGIAAVASRMFFERLQREVNHHLEQFAGRIEADQADAEAQALTPEDIIRRGFGMEQ